MHWLVALLLLLASQAHAATYYVATTGNNSNDGSIGSPWRDPQKCALSPVVAGDTCLVGNGTYTVNASGGVGFDDNYTVLISTNSPSGTASLPITIKSENYLGAKIIIPTTTSINAGFYIDKPYYVIEGFEISGETFSGNQGTGISIHGVYLTGATGVVVRRNTIHDVGRAVCSLSTSGFTGVFDLGSNGAEISYNRVYKVGRLFKDEGICSGGSTSLNANDHAFYIARGINTYIHHNVSYDNDRGYCLNLYRSGQPSTYTHTNVRFVHNTCHHTVGETRGPASLLIIGQTHPSGLTFTNNIFSFSDETCLIQTFNMGTVTGGGFKGNRSNFNDVSGSAFFCGAVPTGMTVDGTNVANASLGFVSAGTDFTLAAGSASIDAGYNDGSGFNGANPDPGAFERFTCSGGTVAGNVLSVQCDMNLNTPLDPGSTGWTVNNGRSVTGVALSGSSVVNLTFDGAACTDVQSWTFAYASGTAKDGINVGGSLNQLLHTISATAVTNNCSGATYTLTQTVGGIYGAIGAQATVATLSRVSPGGLCAVRTKKKATGGTPPSSITTKLQYATDGESGTYADVPDSFGAGNIRFPGLGARFGMDEHATIVSTERLTSQFSGMVSGGVVRCATGCEAPAVAMTQDSETEMVWIVEFDTDTSTSAVYHFREVLVDGTVLTYDASSRPSILVAPFSANAGP